MDDFVPDGGIDFFLDDSSPDKPGPTVNGASVVEKEDSDSDGEGGNPMVASVREDLDEDDEDAAVGGGAADKTEYEVL